MGIKIENVNKQYGSFTALKDINLEINSGELIAFLGPSGSGKTTLLRVLAGLEYPESGRVTINDHDISDKSPRDRNVGFVFQHYALFQHMTVYENVAFGLRVRPKKFRPSKNEIRERVSSLLRLVQLEHFSGRYPSQLSGGQRQRVALARALAVEPGILLLDEPFGALDAKVRKELRRWLRRLHQEVHVTSIFVTHDQEEALEVADRLVIINNGRIEQIGTPQEVYHNPANEFVFNFIGDVNLFHCRMEEGIPEKGNGTGKSSTDMLSKVFARPHSIDLFHGKPERGGIRGTVTHINPAGPFVKVELESELGDSLQASITQERYHELALQTGMSLYISPRKTHEFSQEGESN